MPSIFLVLPSYDTVFHASGTMSSELLEGPSHIRAIVEGMGAVICPLLKAGLDFTPQQRAAIEAELDRLLQAVD